MSGLADADADILLLEPGRLMLGDSLAKKAHGFMRSDKLQEIVRECVPSVKMDI